VLIRPPQAIYEREMKATQAEESRLKQLEWKVTTHLCKSIKWDIIRNKRIEMLKAKQSVEDKNKRVKRFTHLILFYLTLSRTRS
jgi:hypothetical protein